MKGKLDWPLLSVLRASDYTLQNLYKMIWDTTIHSKGSFCLCQSQ